MTVPTGNLITIEIRNEHTRAIECYDYKWVGGDVMRATYPFIMYLPKGDVTYELPLTPGSRVRIGPYRLRVLEEEPWRASVLLIRERGLLTDLCVAWYKVSKIWRWAFSRLVLTLWVWGLADHKEGAIPTWRDIYALRRLAGKEDV